MTSKLVSLTVLSSFLVLSACMGDAPKDEPKKTPKVLSAAPMVKEEPKLEPQLSATAPARPSSILDKPIEAPKPDAPKVEVAEVVDQFEPLHVEPETPQDADFVRPLKADEVKVDRFVLATGVNKREPVGESDVFDTDTKRIFAFVQLENETQPYTFEVHFEKAEGPKSQYGVKLKVPTADRYRTWAWTQIRRAPGLYRAVLRTPEGEEITSREFLIEDAALKSEK